MKSRTALCALVAFALLFSAGAPSPRAAGGGAVDKKDLTIKLKIEDKASGFTLAAKKAIPKGSNAFDAVRHTVAMVYQTDAAAGPVVTSHDQGGGDKGKVRPMSDLISRRASETACRRRRGTYSIAGASSVCLALRHRQGQGRGVHTGG
jgi:hypothetical protein